MSARVRLLAASLTVLAALALSSCRSGEGLRDEGPPGGSLPSSSSAYKVVPASTHAEPPSGNS
ncbi:hypothetical protein ACFV0T_12500 [Streptomyces sp. NPDC059582]|uniref:hypothetical protein n=1 Tax=Streptomyces sp. NPDC059582 TaxID=3346875 RepID=UPI00367C6D00